jgi:hypothetical protein
MLNTYIKNVGSTQTLIGNNCGAHVQEMDWNADYDGNQAKILVNTNLDGKRKMFHYTLDNADLANMLNIDSVKRPLDMRLKMDLKKPQVFRLKPRQYKIELSAPPLAPRAPAYVSEPAISNNSAALMEMLHSASPNSFLSSPASNEEYIVPVTIDRSTPYMMTPKRHNFVAKTHRTHRVFKRPKTTSSIRRRTITRRRPGSARR